MCLSGWDVHLRFPDPDMRNRTWTLRSVDVRLGTLIGFADEMRVGLRGMVRRVWGVRGVKVIQRLQLVYEWKYLFLVVDFARLEVGVGVDGLYEVGDGGASGAGNEAIHAGVGRSSESSQ